MTKRCPVSGCGRSFTDDDAMCPDHVRPLELVDEAEADPAEAAPQAPDAPEAAEAEPAPILIACWNCGWKPEHQDNDVCLNPECRRRLTPPALVIRFPTGQVEVDRGQRVELGRHGDHRRLFTPYRNVSRKHTVIGVDRDGYVWIEPIPTPNGTFIDGDEMEPSIRHPLRTGHVIGLARNIKGTVTVYRRREGGS